MKRSASKTLTVREIAEMCDVAPSTVYAWASKTQALGGYDFPEPLEDSNEDGAQVFSRREVEAWAIRTQRLRMVKGRLYNSDGYDITDQYERVTK